jgi:hypothetical protein
VTTASLQREVDDLVLQLKGLVHVRALLESRGASAEELAEHSEEIARVRGELARLAPVLAASDHQIDRGAGRTVRPGAWALREHATSSPL